MTMTAKSTALEVAALVSEIRKTEATLSEAKARLIALVGDGGETFETALGKVQVTQQTQDRNTGQFSFSLDATKFLAQDERIQANLIRDGIVTRTEKVIKGTAPVVKVTLK